jgi:alpha-beta hydrolase superfamily lysophospholipase
VGESSTEAPRRLELDVSAAAPAGCRRLVGDLFVDGRAARPGRPVLVVCVPGGGMSRRYFDLAVDGEAVPNGAAGDAGGWSMARSLAAAGLWVLTLDHPGVGDSDVPDDPGALGPDAVAATDAAAVAAAAAGLRAGTLVDGLAAVPDLLVVGCGHSMGGLLTVLQQAHHRSYDAVALLGFAGSGLPATLLPAEAPYAGDPASARAAIRDLAEARFGRPLAVGNTGPSPMLLGPGVVVPEAAIAAITASGSPLLVQPGLLSMIPGSSAPEQAAIDVPVFLGVGEHDITHGDPRVIPSEFPACDDVTLFVLRGAGHNHNVAPPRQQLWDRLAAWADGLR